MLGFGMQLRCSAADAGTIIAPVIADATYVYLRRDPRGTEHFIRVSRNNTTR
jgi:hypothetical protein